MKGKRMFEWYDKLFLAGMVIAAIGGIMAIWGFAAMIFATRP